MAGRAKRTVVTMDQRGARVLSFGRIDHERILGQAIEDGLRAAGGELIADVRRTAEFGVVKTGRPARYWPVDTGKSRQGFYAVYRVRERVLLVLNRAVSRGGFNYPLVVEGRRLPVIRLWYARRSKYVGAFARAMRRRFERER